MNKTFFLKKVFKIPLSIFILIFVLMPINSLHSQEKFKTINGTVVSGSNDPLIGVTVKIKNGVTGTITDINGAFTLKTPEDAILEVSYIGYEKKEVSVKLAAKQKIVLLEDVTSLNEVVVVGYGTQKKVNLTGAVSSVDLSEAVESRPLTNLATSLSGLSSGLYVRQTSGRPNANSASLLIRGNGTLNNASPLVIVDGVESSINDLNPMDVASVSVLKDASSSAIYGSRAANGVILVTTKKGIEGKSSITYNSNISVSEPSNTIKLVNNYADYMGYYNKAMENSQLNQPFSSSRIDEWREHPNEPYLYPNTNFFDEVFTKGIMQNHNLSFNVGRKGLSVFGSFGYLNNPGIVENSAYERFTARLNVSAEVKPWITMGMNMSGLRSVADIGSNFTGNLFDAAGSPGIVYRSPDGRYGAPENPQESQQLQSPLYVLNSRIGNIYENRINTRFFGTLKLFKGFSIDGSFNFKFSGSLDEEKPVYADRWSFQTNTITQTNASNTYVRNRSSNNIYLLGDVVARYETTLLNKLQLNAIAGASQEKSNAKWFEAKRLDLIAPNLSVISAAIGAADAQGLASDWVMQSYFSRLNLSWDDKYLFEANMRRDGSSRFSENYRWGIFPSFSLGWRVNEEAFLKNEKWMDMLKVRASWGGLGNNAVGNYESQSVYNDDNYVLNNQVVQGLVRLRLANAAIQWETTNVTNIGVDFSLFNSELSGTIDVFDKDTRNILIALPAPLLVGNASIPTQNAAQVNNKGIEVNLKWRKQIGDFRFNLGGNFTYIKNEVTKFKGKDKAITGVTLLQEGQPINALYVLAVDKILQTDDDLLLVDQMIADAPIDSETNVQKNPFAAYGKPRKGDFLYKDMNQDGIIDENDRYILGNGSTPDITYGFSLGAEWKGFDISCLFQGVTGILSYWQDSFYTTGLVYGSQMNKEIAQNSWVDGRTDATFPRMLYYTNKLNNQPSDFWVQDKSYLRLKNLQLGYNFPVELTKKVDIEQVRLYVSMENLLTFTQYKGIDPEINGTNYPTLKQFSCGVNIKF
ncbi:MAG: TonB-dependent receptor [Paludibacter sp.]|nr:TonB-dependent receptor [Paludibacter sp.]